MNATEVGREDSADTGLPASGSSVGRRIVAASFVVFTAVAVAVYLVSISVPGIVFTPGMVSILALLAVALACAIDLTVFVVQLLTAGARRTPWHLAVIAGLALLVIVAARADLPVKLRFAASRSAFDTYAERVLAESSLHDDPPLPDRLGSFEVRYARVLPEGVIIFDVHGSGSNDAGFAHLPDGDLPAGDGNFESPQFRPLGGGWYAFTSGW